MFLWKSEGSINTYRVCKDLDKLKEYIENWYRKYASSIIDNSTNFIFEKIDENITEVKLDNDIKMGLILKIKEI